MSCHEYVNNKTMMFQHWIVCASLVFLRPCIGHYASRALFWLSWEWGVYCLWVLFWRQTKASEFSTSQKWPPRDHSMPCLMGNTGALKCNQGYIKPLCYIRYYTQTLIRWIHRVLCTEVYTNLSLWRHVAFVGSVRNRKLNWLFVFYIAQ